MIPIGQVHLRGFAGASLRSPSHSFAVGSETGQTVELVGIGHSYGFGFSFCVNNVQLKILKAMLVRIEDQVLARRMIKRSPAHLFHIRDRSLLASIDVHRHDLSPQAVFRKPPPTDLFPIWRKKWTAIVAWGLSELADVGPISVHNENVHHVGQINVKHLLFAFS